jgi:hypothetical protein
MASPDVPGDAPAVHPRQPKHERPRPRLRLSPTEPARDPLKQPVRDRRHRLERRHRLASYLWAVRLYNRRRAATPTDGVVLHRKRHAGPTCATRLAQIITDDLVTHETQYFADPFQAPARRAASAEPIPGRDR